MPSRRFWDTGGGSPLALVDLPYSVEPLGPWEYVEAEARKSDHRP